MSTATSLRAPISGALCVLGLQPAGLADIREGHALSTALIGPEIAGLDRLHEIQAWTGLSIFAFREEGRLTGVFAFLLLNWAGHAALLRDAFDGRAPDLSLVAHGHEHVSAYYGWAFAGSTRPARTALVTGADVLRRQVLTRLPFYCHAATPAGRRAVTEKLGYFDIAGSPSGLLCALPDPAEQRRAA